MPWSYETAKSRIRKLIDSAPRVDVQKFRDDYMPLYEARKVAVAAGKEKASPPLFDLPKGRAVIVDTIQIYITMTNYEDYRLSEGRETPESQADACAFLHLHYGACDRLAEKSDAQRVDFHGPRMHAVVLGQSEGGVTQDDILKAFEFVRDFRQVAKEANENLAGSRFKAEFRVGVDIGTCVAINNGNGLESEPMFLGSAANHAAKLADGNEAGIYLSDRVRNLLELPIVGSVLEGVMPLDEQRFASFLALRDQIIEASGFAKSYQVRDILESWQGEVLAKSVIDPRLPNFVFHHAEPPLSEIQYDKLYPSNSVRMELVSVFADLSGYTAYIDEAVAKGEIADAVTALYVMRQEFQNVVEDDFGGRKVRFIGDCIHAVLAEGSSIATDAKASVVSSLKCAGGLRSSFEVCRSELEGIDSLGLAIGVEFGPTPVTRVGIRGLRSVRLASSIATATSEKVQRSCNENETILGPTARALAPSAFTEMLNESGCVDGLTHSDVVTSLATPVSPAAPVIARAHVEPEREVSRAHSVIR